MSIDESMQRCPQCNAEIERMSRAMHDIGELTFCLKCHFPLLLIAGKYRLQEMLDRGGFGEIYLAHHINLKRDYERVVKIVKHDMLASGGMRKRFQREVHVTSILSSENNHIVRIYDDFGEIPQIGYFYVMEYLEGVPLTRLLEDPKNLPPLPLCFHIFQQLCDAMEAAHRVGVVHRDLKPDNIFLVRRSDDPYFVKVLDFGIAKPLDRWGEHSMVATQGVLGTPLYMAPEQWDDAVIDHRTDIYAMGVLFYEMLTGRTPFWDRISKRSPHSIMTDHLMTSPMPVQEARPDRNIPVSIAQLVQQALAKEPSTRFPSVRRWRQAMERAYISTKLWPSHGWSEEFIPEEEWGAIQNYLRPQTSKQEVRKGDLQPPSFQWPRAHSDEWQRDRLESFGQLQSGMAFVDTHPADGKVRDRSPQRRTSPYPQHLYDGEHASHATQDRARSPEAYTKEPKPEMFASGNVHFPSQEFPTHRSGPYKIKNLHGAVDSQYIDDIGDSDDEIQPFHTSRTWLWGSLLLMTLCVWGSIWFILQLNKDRPSSKNPSLGGAICGPIHSSWQPHTLRILVLPFVSSKMRKSENPKQLRYKRYMQQSLQQTLQHIIGTIGIPSRAFLTLRMSEKGFVEPNPKRNQKQARMYGTNCGADLVLSGTWLTTQGSLSPQKAAYASATSSGAQMWLRLFATYTGAAISSNPKDPSQPSVKPKDLDELLQVGNTNELKRSKIRTMIHGLLWLQTARYVNDSWHLQQYAWAHAKRSFLALGTKLPSPLQPKKHTKHLSPEVLIPEGAFLMGTQKSPKKRTLARFYIDRYEVSREQYALCVLQGHCTPISRWLNPPWTYPRDRVSPKQARRYCSSLGKKLPTEEQWVKSARGGLRIHGRINRHPSRPYSWGTSKPTCKHANVKWCYKIKAEKQMVPTLVPFFRKLRDISPYGVYHMIGNVAEIIRDGSIKGGNGFSNPNPIVWKDNMDQRSGLQWVGFRCVRE